jgi:hypothetical protein
VNGDSNIFIGASGTDGSGTIRIGGTFQTSTFIAGIFGGSVIAGLPVLVDDVGRLGTVNSSRRFKFDIADMGEASSGVMRLRPGHLPLQGRDRRRARIQSSTGSSPRKWPKSTATWWCTMRTVRR